MENRPVPHLQKNVCQMYQRGDLKRLTICYAEGYICLSEYLWCEIELLSGKNKASIYFEGKTPFGYTLGLGAFEAETCVYEEKTKVFECEIPEREVMRFLSKVFYDYDLRLLGDEALEHHPAYNYDYIYGTMSMDEMTDRLIIELEATDGTIDQVKMRKDSIAGNILMSFIHQSETLSKILVI